MMRDYKGYLRKLMFLIFMAFIAGAVIDNALSAINPRLALLMLVLYTAIYCYLLWRLKK